MAFLFARVRPELNPLSILAGGLVFFGAFSLLRDQLPGDSTLAPCDAEDEVYCAADVGGATGELPAAAEAAWSAPRVDARSVCGNAGYLCGALAAGDRVQIRRWKDFSGTVVVHVPRPDFEDSGDAIDLQQAAATGLRAWNGQPFQILTDLSGDREPHFAVVWTRSLTGGQIGVARTRWSLRDGLTVVSIELATRDPFDTGRVIRTRQIRLTAAHEMGHALGLPHSDSERDVMYPTNTATSLTARDYRTMEVLYGLEDGTEIVP